MLRRIVIASLALFCAACSTSFDGSPYFPGGPRVCFEKCDKANMEMSAFVYSGEFATACVCQPRGRSARAQGDLGAIVGVIRRMQNEEAAVLGGVIGGAPGGAAAGAIR